MAESIDVSTARAALGRNGERVWLEHRWEEVLNFLEIVRIVAAAIALMLVTDLLRGRF